ncbi:MAG TPA: STAS domain-containing protein [Tepidisphaeraceae bacterium]|nr:STAS domain-containing protein [Tepidisphaeraceae bacterium]
MAEESSESQPRVLTETVGQALVVHVFAKMLNDKDLVQLNQTLVTAGPSSGIHIIVFDMSRVQILSSLVLGYLVELTEKCQKRNQTLKLAAVHPQARDVIKLTRLDRVLHISDTVEVALHS